MRDRQWGNATLIAPFLVATTPKVLWMASSVLTVRKVLAITIVAVLTAGGSQANPTGIGGDANNEEMWRLQVAHVMPRSRIILSL